MYNSLKKLYFELSKPEQRRLFLLLILIVITGIVQVAGIISIFPFIAVASNPDVIDTNQYLSFFKELLSIEDNKNFLIVLGLMVLLVLILTNAFLAFSTWVTMRFVVGIVHTLSYRMLLRYLGETYIFHLSRNSSELLKNLTSEINRVVNGGIVSALTIISKGFTVLCILILLIAVDPIVALLAATTLGGAYSVVYLALKNKLAKVGAITTVLFTDRLKCINESIGGIKELMVLGRSHFYLQKFKFISQEIIKHQVFNRASVDIPKYLLETIAFGGILIIAIYLVAVRNNVENIMPIIALYGFAGYRLMPALQEIFKSMATLKHDIVAVDVFYDDLQGTSSHPFKGELIERPEKNKLIIDKTISLENISFSYPSTSKPSVNDISISIKANSCIGIIGKSGSGKTTLVDIILGLLEPTSGNIKIDGISLNHENIRQWQNTIGYVPQSIFLADATISENIAFGIPTQEIDHNKIVTATKMANLHDFIIEELEGGYDTIVGERGVRLSGGQRQRIGIARALYHNPNVLILDEATSALDTNTEKSVMDSVRGLMGQKTIIMIAHRMSTVENCDTLFWLEKGSVKASGAYQELLKNNRDFSDFIKPSKLKK